MKLSEMTTDQAADALVRLVEPAAEIVNDEKVFKVIQGAGKIAKATWQVQLAYILREVAPVLLKDHRNALYEVLSIMTGKEVAAISKQPITATIEDIRNSVDAELLRFFTPSEEQAKSGATE